MKPINILLLVFLSFVAQAQTTNKKEKAKDYPIFIRYKALRTFDSTNEYLNWYYKHKQIHYLIQHYNLADGYPVIIKGKVEIFTDSTAYIDKYREWKEQTEADYAKRKPSVNSRNYGSDVSIYHRYLDFLDKGKTLLYTVTDTLYPMNNWEIGTDTMRVLGFLCQKATINFRGTVYTAYFTNEIPYPAGPNNFRGLPGLILYVVSSSGKTGYIATEIINPYKKEVPSVKLDGIKVSQKEMEAIITEENKRRMAGIGNFKTN
jgi:GLPGLI family protein